MGNRRGKLETASEFNFGGLQNPADNDCRKLYKTNNLVSLVNESQEEEKDGKRTKD